jgi:site-specific DNA recombinase
MRAIAGMLNKRKVPSPGSTWKRETRRATGWICSTIRVILRNPIYKGELIWNRYQWTKDPDTGKRNCKLRPESEWIRHHFEELRIVSDDLWEQVHRRRGGTRLRGGVAEPA